MEDKKQDERARPIDINGVFPDASGLLSFRPLALKDIWPDCLVVLDTNVLLVPYGTGKNSLDQIQRTYADLVRQRRLIIPGQVAREFAINRSEKLKSLYQQVTKKSALQFTPADYPLLDGVPDYQAVRQIEKELDDKIAEYRKAVRRLTSVVKDWYWDDPVTTVYRESFDDSVVYDSPGRTPDFEAQLSNRFRNRVPPGNKDASKHDGGAGDVLIWLTILDVAKIRQAHTVFVSADEKADWWHQSESTALYPRFELVDEYRRVTGGKTFRIINFSGLLELSGVSGDVVGEVERAESVIEKRAAFASKSLSVVRGMQAVRAVQNWVSNSCGEELGAAPPGFDFSITHDGETFIFVARHLPRAAMLPAILDELVAIPVPDGVAMAYYVFVSPDPLKVPFLESILPWRDLSNRGYLLGRIDDNGDYVRELGFSHGKALAGLGDSE